MEEPKAHRGLKNNSFVQPAHLSVSRGEIFFLLGCFTGSESSNRCVMCCLSRESYCRQPSPSPVPFFSAAVERVMIIAQVKT